MPPTAASFEQFAADQLLLQSEEITRRWVEKLSSQMGIRPRRVLPTHALLDHIPEVLEKAAEFLTADDERVLTRERLVTEELGRIARLRRTQGYEVREVVREFEVLAGILDEAALEWVDAYPAAPEPKAVGRVFGRLNRAPLLMGEITVGAYHEAEIQERWSAARLLREFADTLAHQLKTPLGAAEGAAMLLENEEITSAPEERRRFAGIVQRNLRRARAVVDDVRELALAQSAQAKAGRALPVAQVLGEVLAEIRDYLRENDVRIEVREPVPDLALDAARVEIVLLNLLSNAAKYFDPGKPVRWVRIAFEQEEGGGWWASVSDNGLGIAPEHQGHIFERFFRAHPEAAEGTGLGLSIAQEAIQQLGSRLEFESQPGVGTTFRFFLPKPEEEDSAEAGSR